MGNIPPFFFIIIMFILFSGIETWAGKRDANVVIQVLSSANGRGEVGECE